MADAPGLSTIEPASAEPSRRTGRPRKPETERSIIDSTLAIIDSDGIDGLSVEAVASRAGVGKGAIYRRWPNKDALIADALASLTEELPEFPPGTSVRDELVELVDTIRRSSQDSLAGRIMPRLIGAARSNPHLMAAYRERVVERRAQRMRSVVERGIASGELREDIDIDVALTLIVGPMLYKTMLSSRTKLTRQASADLVDLALTGIAR